VSLRILNRERTQKLSEESVLKDGRRYESHAGAVIMRSLGRPKGGRRHWRDQKVEGPKKKNPLRVQPDAGGGDRSILRLRNGNEKRARRTTLEVGPFGAV